MKKFATGLFRLMVLLSVVLLQSCDSSTTDAPPPAQQPGWSRFIHSHTDGSISSQSTVTIRFSTDIAPQALAGKSAEDAIKIEPSIDARIIFNTVREITIEPKEALKSGKKYRISVLAEKLAEVPKELQPYQFDVSVIQQDFDIAIQGLESVDNNEKLMQLRGTLTTADNANDADIEKMLSARHTDKDLGIEWEHQSAVHQHRFTITGITRSDAKSEVKLSWTGDPIDVSSEGSREISVPILGSFQVTRVQAVQGNRQYIQVQFSEPLDDKQNLDGLVDLGGQVFTTRIENNALNIYPDNGIQGRSTVRIAAGIRNQTGIKLQTPLEQTVFFTREKPRVRFVGNGVILPDNKVLSIPFEAVNVHSVQVAAFQVYDNNIGQFLQSNKIDGQNELHRVGRYLWQKTIALSDLEADKWTRYNLDATELLKKNPGGLFRLTLSVNRSNSTYSCNEADNAVPVRKTDEQKSHDDLSTNEYSSWEYAEEYYNVYSSERWQDRSNPCKDDYYQFSGDVKSSRNFLASNIGIIAKRDATGEIRIITTSLDTAQPMADVAIELMNFQNQRITSLKTDSNGFAKSTPQGIPFYLVAEKGKQTGYLKLSQGNALPTSHFDVGGSKVQQGIKGMLYGERGVWRPGDDIHLTFVLQDEKDVIPAGHPVTVQLHDPKGQLVQTVTNSTPVEDFYTFQLHTKDDAPTGNWTAKALVGGATFSKTLKIETVIPNRLKLELEFGSDTLRQSGPPSEGRLFAQWLHGATAANLKADVNVKLRSIPTRFTTFGDYQFDDPARQFESSSEELFTGQLDSQGRASFKSPIRANADAPGMLRANFTSRVFEEGGAFSTSHSSKNFHAFDHYVGIKLPKGDPARGMLLTDTKHRAEIATVDADGNPVDVQNLEVAIYKVEWKWWWDKSGDSLASYANSSHRQAIHRSKVSSSKGRAQWEFEVKYPDWGRYLVRACDLDGGHCTGQIVYIDWPGWAGRAQEQRGAGASMLTFFADKKEYKVGDTAVLQLPDATQGRALFTIETGSRILQQKWIEFGKDNTQVKVPITAGMAPNVYAHITVVQPHAGRNNDRPIRLYGIAPINVTDPATQLEPEISAADEWEPESKVEFTVKEKQGRSMTYTVAIVDEGLLGLTSYKTPDLHNFFYRKEAHGIISWDLFDEVVGAYGAELERLLALGGGDSKEDEDNKSDKKRFPPVVKFLGPFQLEAGKTGKHSLTLPPYVGAVRAMVVAGHQSAYGKTDKSIFVRSDLAIAPTVPRVLGPGEDITIPVAIFSMSPNVKEAQLSMSVDGQLFSMPEPVPVKVSFDKPGEQMAFLKLKVKDQIGKGSLKFVAKSGNIESEQTIHIEVRSPNPSTIQQFSHTLPAGESWTQAIKPHGLKGTNSATLEVSVVPPINLQRRLRYLIRYPHGCLEQVTSSVFPQLYLDKLVKLNDQQAKQVQGNINAGIQRLRSFQNHDGVFNYWPGNINVNGWANNYAGHFLLEAQRLGYMVPAEMLNGWLQQQQLQAKSWTRSTAATAEVQAYRLYTLALAGNASMGAMNRLRESGSLGTLARAYLAAAYQQAGQRDVAREILDADSLNPVEYVSINPTFGSTLRDDAVILNTLIMVGNLEDGVPRAQSISKELSTDRWHSTQSIAYALMAMARYSEEHGNGSYFSFHYKLGKANKTVESERPIYQLDLPIGESEASLEVQNKDDKPMYLSVIVHGTPPAGTETSANEGLEMTVSYLDNEGRSVSMDQLAQGRDLVARVTVTNRTAHVIEHVALTHMSPTGFEIHNQRLGDDTTTNASSIDYQDIRDDRVLSYFSLKAGEQRQLDVRFNAAYPGRCYLPAIQAEAMYDAGKHARIKGQWLEIVRKKP